MGTATETFARPTFPNAARGSSTGGSASEPNSPEDSAFKASATGSTIVIRRWSALRRGTRGRGCAGVASGSRDGSVSALRDGLAACTPDVWSSWIFGAPPAAGVFAASCRLAAVPWRAWSQARSLLIQLEMGESSRCVRDQQ